MIDVKEFLFALSKKVKPEVLEGLDSVFHFDISGAGQYTVKVHNGQIETEQGLVGEANCKVSTSEDAFNKLLAGELNPMTAMFTGKLKISNPVEMMKYAKIFGLMK
jgi:putative sterol carrier protein